MDCLCKLFRKKKKQHILYICIVTNLYDNIKYQFVNYNFQYFNTNRYVYYNISEIFNKSTTEYLHLNIKFINVINKTIIDNYTVYIPNDILLCKNLIFANSNSSLTIKNINNIVLTFKI